MAFVHTHNLKMRREKLYRILDDMEIKHKTAVAAYDAKKKAVKQEIEQLDRDLDRAARE